MGREDMGEEIQTPCGMFKNNNFHYAVQVSEGAPINTSEARLSDTFYLFALLYINDLPVQTNC